METVTALILLPVEYNPDEKRKWGQIPIKDFQVTAVEISDLFEKHGLGCTIDPYPKLGIWAKLGVIYEDINAILEINSLLKPKEGGLLTIARMSCWIGLSKKQF